MRRSDVREVATLAKEVAFTYPPPPKRNMVFPLLTSALYQKLLSGRALSVYHVSNEGS